jgi:hypothetical protein
MRSTSISHTRDRRRGHVDGTNLHGVSNGVWIGDLVPKYVRQQIALQILPCALITPLHPKIRNSSPHARESLPSTVIGVLVEGGQPGVRSIVL